MLLQLPRGWFLTAGLGRNPARSARDNVPLGLWPVALFAVASAGFAFWSIRLSESCFQRSGFSARFCRSASSAAPLRRASNRSPCVWGAHDD